MKNVYACLLGNWVNLSTDDTATIGEDHVSAFVNLLLNSKNSIKSVFFILSPPSIRITSTNQHRTLPRSFLPHLLASLFYHIHSIDSIAVLHPIYLLILTDYILVSIYIVLTYPYFDWT